MSNIKERFAAVLESQPAWIAVLTADDHAEKGASVWLLDVPSRAASASFIRAINSLALSGFPLALMEAATVSVNDGQQEVTTSLGEFVAMTGLLKDVGCFGRLRWKQELEAAECRLAEYAADGPGERGTAA